MKPGRWSFNPPLLPLLVMLGDSAAFAATFNASATSDWSSNATWGGSGRPTSSDDAIINRGVTASVTADATVHSVTFPGLTGTSMATLSVNSGITLIGSGDITMTSPYQVNPPALLLALPDLGAQTAGPSVNTDLLDYAPGATARVCGSGFRPGETVQLQVLHTDGTPNTGQGHDPWPVVADTRGDFQTAWFVARDDSLGSTFQLTAFGTTSRLTARTSFADGSYTWTGTTSTEWNLAANWGGSGPPTGADSVTIPSSPTGGRFPTVSGSSGNVACSNLVLNSGAALTMTGGSLTNSGSLTINSTATVTISGGRLTSYNRGDITLNGSVSQSGGTLACSHNWSGSGSYNATGGTVEFLGNNNGQLNAGPTYNFFNVLIDAGATTKFDIGAIIVGVAGNWTNNGAPTLTGQATTINLNGTSSQTIAGSSTTTFRNLTIANTQAAVSATTSLNLSSGTCTVNNGADLELGTSIMGGSGGTFTLASGGTLGIGSTAGITSSGATGNIRTATRNYNTGANYTYNGTSAQVTGNGLPATVNSLAINNSAGVTLTKAETISGNVALGSSGQLKISTTTQNSTANTLTIGGASQPAGKWGSTASAATYKDNTRFASTGSGMLTIRTGSGAYRLTGTGQPQVGVGYTVNVALVDASGATITSYSGTKSLTFNPTPTLSAGADGSAATINGVAQNVAANVTFTSGTGTVTLVAHRAESGKVISVTDGTFTSGGTGGASLTVGPTAGVDSAYRITATTTTPTAGSSDALTINLVDQYQNVSTYSGDKTLTFSGLGTAPNGTVPTVTSKGGSAVNEGTGTTITFSSGQSLAGGTLIAYKAEGPVTLAATDGTWSTSTSGGAGVSLTVFAAANSAYRITAASTTPTAGTSDALTIKLVDPYQNVSTYSGDQTLTFSGLGTAPNGTAPTVTSKTGSAINEGTPTTITFASGVSSSGGTLVAYRVEGPVTLAATDGTLSTSMTGGTGASLTVSSATANHLAFSTQPAGASYKSVFGTQPVVKSQDVYGNNSTSSLGASLFVAVSLSTGAGPLAGTTSRDIGTTHGNGTVTYTNLQINKAENGDVLTASATGFTSGTSSGFNVAAANLTVVSGLTGNSKVYDGTTSATLSSNNVSLTGVAAGDSGNIALSTNGYAASFATATVGNGKTVTVSGLSLTGSAAGNYTLTQPTLVANVTAATLTVASGLMGNNRVYDGSTTATISSNNVSLSGIVSGDNGNLRLSTNGYTASFATATVGNGKTVTVSGLSLAGSAASNYSLTQPTLTANITAADQTISFAPIPDQLTSNTVVLSATASSGLTVTFAVASGPGSLANGTNLTFTAAGTVTITASQAGNGNWNAAPDVSRPFNVNTLPIPASPTVQRWPLGAMKMRAAALLGTDPDGDSLWLLSAGPATAHGGTISTNGGWVFYTPAAGFTNADSFAYIVSDSRGGTNGGVVTVNLTANAAPSKNYTIEVLGNGSVLVHFSAIPGRIYAVQFSDSLQPANWQPLATQTASASGQFTCADSPPGNPNSRFYQAVHIQP
jgi:trimeric autotransporter adhesin